MGFENGKANRFNEAGAQRPRIAGRARRERRAHARFNEAGAQRPRIGSYDLEGRLIIGVLQ